MKKILFILLISIQCNGQGVNIGVNSIANNSLSNEGTATGKNSKATDPQSTVNGLNASAAFSTMYDAAANNNGQNLASGAFARVMSWRGVGLGPYCVIGSTSATGAGYGVVVNKVHGAGFGRGVYLPNIPDSIYGAPAPAAFGGSMAVDFGIANWWGHRFKVPPSGVAIGSFIPSLRTLIYHGQDAYDELDGTDINVAGGHYGSAGGKGTGTGLGGENRFYVAPVKNWGGNKKNPYIIAARFFGTGNYVAQKGGIAVDIPCSMHTWNSTSQGILPPRLTLEERNAIINPEEGLMLYNKTYHSLEFFNGTVWVTINMQIP